MLITRNLSRFREDIPLHLSLWVLATFTLLVAEVAERI
jgi:hypothetical protein